MSVPPQSWTSLHIARQGTMCSLLIRKDINNNKDAGDGDLRTEPAFCSVIRHDSAAQHSEATLFKLAQVKERDEGDPPSSGPMETPFVFTYELMCFCCACLWTRNIYQTVMFLLLLAVKEPQTWHWGENELTTCRVLPLLISLLVSHASDQLAPSKCVVRGTSWKW